ncbi:hypothetical protein D1BOALGB6SA_4982 [Olavius sp. associated proteobacterium Delta 1]|nr:hypothetical protein D1BOALGB6SA_4982 [Olavius sp. associated proteobacterium Delta 1]
MLFVLFIAGCANDELSIYNAMTAKPSISVTPDECTASISWKMYKDGYCDNTFGKTNPQNSWIISDNYDVYDYEWEATQCTVGGKEATCFGTPWSTGFKGYDCSVATRDTYRSYKVRWEGALKDDRCQVEEPPEVVVEPEEPAQEPPAETNPEKTLDIQDSENNPNLWLIGGALILAVAGFVLTVIGLFPVGIPVFLIGLAVVIIQAV